MTVLLDIDDVFTQQFSLSKLNLRIRVYAFQLHDQSVFHLQGRTLIEITLRFSCTLYKFSFVQNFKLAVSD